MNKLFKMLLSVTIVITLESPFILPVEATESSSLNNSEYVEGEVIINYKKESNLENVEDALDGQKVSLNSTEKEVVKNVEDQQAIDENTALLTLEDDVDVQEAIEHLEDLKDVASVQPNFIYELLEDEVTTDDPYATGDYCYYLDNTNVKKAWAITQTNQSVTVAVIDTGCNLEHVDLKNNLDADNAYDAVTEKYLKNESVKNNGDPVGHGTHVCGLIGAIANNSEGIVGTSYNAKVLPVNVFQKASGSNYTATSETIVSALTYIDNLIENNARTDIKVINMSLGGYDFSSIDSALETKINHLLRAHNVLTVCAAGNESSSSYMYPSDFDACISVEASDENDAYASFTNISEYKDITAPGVSIVSTAAGRLIYSNHYTSSNSSYVYMSGTSMASPITAGIVALLYATVPTATAEQVRTALYDGATAITNKADNDGSHGLVNAYASIKKLQANLNIQQTCSHNYVTVVKNRKEATCKDEGYTGDTCCSHCGEVLSTGTVLPKTNQHSWNSGVSSTNANITTTTYTCTVCGATYSTTSVAHTHTLGVHHEAVAATCVSTGTVEYWDCTGCSSKLDANGNVFNTITVAKDLNNHTGNTVVKNKVTATCKEEGYTGDTYCADCDTILYNGEIVPKTTTHSWNTGTITKEATCTEKGEITYTCTVCGTTKTEDIAKKAHQSGTYHSGVAATCTTSGTKEYWTCKECLTKIDASGNEITDITLPATGHSYSGYIGGYSATCLRGSYSGYRICTKCFTTLDYGYYGGVGAHAYTAYTVAPTESAGGYTLHTCTLCGTSYIDSYTAATGIVINKSVTYSKKKKKTVSCKLSDSAYKKATYKKTSGSKKLTISSRGVVTVKKGTARGTYTIKVKATVKKTKKTKTYTINITVK